MLEVMLALQQEDLGRVELRSGHLEEGWTSYLLGETPFGEDRYVTPVELWRIGRPTYGPWDLSEANKSLDKG